MTLITADQTRAFYEHRGLCLGEQAEDVTRCSHCEDPTDPDDLGHLDGQDVCVPCLAALTGDDFGAPDRARDL
jgi:hypothetical protein